MTALILDNPAGRPARIWNVRAFLTRLGQSIDGMVSGLAARSVPEWRLREVQGEIARFRKLTGDETVSPRC